MDINYTPKIGICGFKNLGNTCYLNSILQLLIHSQIIICFLKKKQNIIDDKNIEYEPSNYETYLKKASIERVAEKERKKFKLEDNDEINIKKSDIINLINISILDKLAEIINTIFSKGTAVIEPITLKQTLDKKIRSFANFQQQDSHECLLQILDKFIEETGIESEPEINNIPDSINNYLEFYNLIQDNLKNNDNIEEKKKEIQKLNNYITHNKDIINKYNGLNYMIKIFKKRYNPLIYQIKNFLINYITCDNCLNQTCNFEDATVLSIPAEESIDESFKSFTKKEIIENYHCSVCESKQQASKNCKLFKGSMVLFIHLKRFKQFGNNRIQKDNKIVEIPDILDLHDYYDSSMINETNTKYKLKGISNHHGGLNGGHYTADCLCVIDNKTWYHFDDSRVSKINNLDTSSAYVLMYEMIFI